MSSCSSGALSIRTSASSLSLSRLPFILLNVFFGYRYKPGKTGRIVHTEVGQNLPVKIYAAFFKAGYELAVRKVCHPYSRIYPGNPEGPELSLPDLPVPERIIKTFIYGLHCSLQTYPSAAVKTLSQLQ